MRLTSICLASVVVLVSSQAMALQSSGYKVEYRVLNSEIALVSQPTTREAAKVLRRTKAQSFEAIVRCAVDDGGALSDCKADGHVSRASDKVRRAASYLGNRIKVEGTAKTKTAALSDKAISILIRADDGVTSICPQPRCESLFVGFPTPPPPSPPLSPLRSR